MQPRCGSLRYPNLFFLCLQPRTMHVPAETEHGSAFYLLSAGAVGVQRERMKEGNPHQALAYECAAFLYARSPFSLFLDVWRSEMMQASIGREAGSNYQIRTLRHHRCRSTASRLSKTILSSCLMERDEQTDARTPVVSRSKTVRELSNRFYLIHGSQNFSEK